MTVSELRTSTNKGKITSRQLPEHSMYVYITCIVCSTYNIIEDGHRRGIHQSFTCILRGITLVNTFNYTAFIGIFVLVFVVGLDLQ